MQGRENPLGQGCRALLLAINIAAKAVLVLDY